MVLENRQVIEVECQQKKQQHFGVHFSESETHCHVTVEDEHGRPFVFIQERYDKECRKHQCVENLYQHGCVIWVVSYKSESSSRMNP